MRFYDDDVLKALIAIEWQMNRYYTGCYNDNAPLKAVDKAIVSKLLPKIEDVLVQDAVKGGRHSIKYLTNPRTQNSLILADNAIFCAYEDTTKDYLADCCVPIEEKVNRIEEGKKLLEMIDDLHLLSISDFVEKHYKEYEHKGLEKLLDFLYENYNDEKFYLRHINSKGILGDMKYKNIEPVLAQFFNANKVKYRGEYENGKLYLDGEEVIDVRVTYNATSQFKYENGNEKVKDHLFTMDLNIKLYFEKYPPVYVELKDVSEAWHDKLGKKIEQESFLHRVGDLKRYRSLDYHKKVECYER